MPLTAEEIIRYQLEIDAQRAEKRLNDVSKAANKADASITNTKESTNKLTNSLKRMAFGAVVAMAVFRAINFVEESLRKAAETAKQFETSLFRLTNVERILSQGGVETSVAGLRKGIQEIKELLPIFSEADITQQVSLIGIMTKDLGLTEDKIIDVAKAIGVLNIRSGESEDLLSTTNKVLTALVAPSGRGIASLGLDFGQANLEALAFKNGILEAGEAFSDLTKHEKDMLKIAILLESTGEELSGIQEFLETNTGALAEQSAEWEDLLRVVGQFVIGLKASVAPLFIEIIKGSVDAINAIKAILVVFQSLEDAFTSFVIILSTFFANPIDFIRNFDGIADAITEVFTTSMEDGFNKMFSGQVPDNAPEWFKRLFGEFEKNADEATGAINSLSDEVADLSELDLDDLVDDLEKLAHKAQEAKEEFEIDSSRDLQDYLLDRSRLNEDYALKREDILRDSNKKIADIQAKSRQKEINEEAKFQEKMRQLREKFLFSLEDALRERDARQVIRLQRQYEMDKEALINENALAKKERAAEIARQIQEAKAARDERLRLLEEERQLKLARQKEDFDLKRQRAEEDHQRELDDIAKQVDERLALFVEEAVEAGLISEEAATTLLNSLKEFYGSGGLFDNLYSANTESLLKNAQISLDGMASVVSGAISMANAVAAATASVRANLASIGAASDGFKGSTKIDSSAKTSSLSEIVPISAFTPSNIPTSVFSGGGNVGGNINVRVDLSPDLEARIINESLNQVSSTINTIVRER